MIVIDQSDSFVPDPGLSPGAKAGIIVGAVLGVILVGAAVGSAIYHYYNSDGKHLLQIILREKTSLLCNIYI